MQAAFPKIDVLINNAADTSEVLFGERSYHDIAASVNANFGAVAFCTQAALKLMDQGVMLFTGSIYGLPFGGNPTLALYSASKAALHSYTQSLRISLEETSVKVFELMPPLVDTEFSEMIGGSKGIQPSVVAMDLLKAFANDEYEIHTGNTANIYKLFLSSPAEALKAMNANRKEILSAVQ